VKLKQELIQLKGLHQELLDLSRVAVGLLQGGNLAALEDAWTKQKVCFKRLTALRQKLKTKLNQWEKNLAAMPPEEAGACRYLIASIDQMSRKTLVEDKKAAELLKAAQKELQAKLERVGKGQKLLKAYGQSPRRVMPGRISKTG